MDLVDILDIENLSLLEIFLMDYLYGLSICGNDLYFCEGVNGFKVFDIIDFMELDENL